MNENSFEVNIKKLNKIITEMEAGNIDQLDDMLDKYEQGINSIKRCNQILQEAELRVEKIMESMASKSKVGHGDMTPTKKD